MRPASTSEQRKAIDEVELALARQPTVVDSVSRALFDATELQDFETLRVRSPFDVPARNTGLVSPSDLAGNYSLGVVTLTWNPGPMNRVRAATLDREGSDLRLGQRVYRGIDGGELSLVATLPSGEAVWRDLQMPIAASRLAYQIWVVLLRHDGSDDVLVDAERSDLVTVVTPEHFTLSLVHGNGEQAAFLIQVNLPNAVGDRQVTARIGEDVRLGPATTGLMLKALDTTRQDALTTQQRLLLTTDGSLVLDPDTHEPRTTQTQVLKPVTRLVATLASRDGALRTLHVDLP